MIERDDDENIGFLTSPISIAVERIRRMRFPTTSQVNISHATNSLQTKARIS